MNLDLKNEGDKVEIKGKKSFRQKLKYFWSVKRNRVITIIVMIVLILATVALGFYFLIYKKDAVNFNLDVKKEETTQPILYQSILDGTMVDAESANRHPLGVMVENHVDARPQSGLSKASIVYEAIAEGGITRFLAIYGPQSSEKIGPVRSARTYYVDWAKEISAYYAHVGGNYDALQLIKSVGIFDLDQFANPSAYWRDNSRKVSSEHTMYAAASKLYRIASDKKYTTENKFIPYQFKTELPLESRPAGETISINFGNASYNVDYTYDPTNNQYLRNLAGKPHIDAENNQQLMAKNVIVQIVKRTPTITAINEQGWIMNTVGSGEASIFLDGKETKATWKKDNSDARTRFYDKSGIEIKFNPGTTWIEILSPDLSFITK